MQTCCYIQKGNLLSNSISTFFGHYLVSEKSVDIRKEREENSLEEMKTNTCKKKFEFHSTNSRNVQNKLMKVVFHDLHDVKGNILKRTVD